MMTCCCFLFTRARNPSFFLIPLYCEQVNCSGVAHTYLLVPSSSFLSQIHLTKCEITCLYVVSNTVSIRGGWCTARFVLIPIVNFVRFALETKLNSGWCSNFKIIITNLNTTNELVLFTDSRLNYVIIYSKTTNVESFMRFKVSSVFIYTPFLIQDEDKYKFE